MAWSINSRKLLGALFALVLGFGYLSALVNLYFAVHLADGKPGLTVRDIVVKYYGDRDETLLGTMVQGSMRENLKDDTQLKVILDWLKGGATQATFAPVKAILDEQCVKCHNPFGTALFRPLTTFEEVAKTTTPNMGMAWGQIARISHQHFFGIGLLCFVVGWLLLQTPLPRQFVAGLLVFGFVGMTIDLLGMWLTKLSPHWAFTIVLGGAMTGLYFGIGVFTIWWDFFFGKNDAS
jgi:hypothetical protein